MKAHPMNAVDTIKNKVARGLVMDIKGNWVSMASLRSIERNVLMHLENGEVLYEGKWARLNTLKIATQNSPGNGIPPAPKTDHISVSANDIELVTNKKAIPWKVVSLSTGEQHSAPENMIPVIREIGLEEGAPESPSSVWENATNSQLKIIALVASAIVLLSLAIFIGIRLIF
jgi:hypothetical protein